MHDLEYSSAKGPVRGQPFVDNYLLYLLARASNVASGQFHAELAQLGIPITTWRILAVLHEAGPVTIGELAQKCLFKQPTLTKAIDRLEIDGLAARESGRRDRRQVVVSITAQGTKIVAGLIERAQRHEREVLASLSPAETDALKSALKNLIAIQQP